MKDQRIVICGASTGIGFAAAKRLCAAGAALVMTSRSAEKLRKAAAACPGAQWRALDASSEAAVAAFFSEADEFEHLVLSMNSQPATGPFTSITDQQLRDAFETKFWTYVTVLRHALPKIRRGGSVTLVTGTSARKPMKNIAGLAATNGALEAMVGSLALEMAPTRINAVSPALIDTPYWDASPKDWKDDVFNRMTNNLPAQRIGDADDVAQAIEALMLNTFITGVVLPVDGGLCVT